MDRRLRIQHKSRQIHNQTTSFNLNSSQKKKNKSQREPEGP